MSITVDFPLYLITDRKQVAAGHNLLSATQAALCGGVRAVQLREKDLSAAELLPLARDLRSLTNHYHALLLINDRIDVALACQADGVHLGGHSLPTDVARALLGPDRLIGVSTHSLDEIRIAADLGADFVTYGPIYETPAKVKYGPPRGIEALRDACRDTLSLPIYALGGINQANQQQVLSAGAAGIALISAVFAQADPATAVREFCLS